MFNNELWQKPAGGAGGGDFYTHQIANSCRFNASATSHMYHTQGTPTNVDKCTISLWVKRGKLGAAMYAFTGSGSAAAGDYSHLSFGGTGNDPDLFYYLQNENSPVTVELESTALFRDPSAWMNLVIAQDSTQGTAANRNKIYINGVQYTDWGAFTQYSNLNSNFSINTSGHKIFVGSGGDSGGGAYLPYDGYIAEYVFIDGTQYAASDFGETKNGVWIPKDPSGLTFGNNGAYLKFESSADLGNDSSGNNNDFTLSSIAAHDQMLDSPTFGSEGSANFPTANPLIKDTLLSSLTEGNLKFDMATNNRGGTCNFAIPLTGKWYWEMYCGGSAGGDEFWTAIGLAGRDLTASRGGYAATGNYGVVFSNYSGSNYYPRKIENGSLNTTEGGSLGTSTTGVIGIAVNRDDDELKAYVNNTLEWTMNISGTDEYFPVFGLGGATDAARFEVLNFGQDGTFAGAVTAGGNADGNGYGNFTYSPPTGFLSLNSANLPTADAVDPAQTDDNYPQKLFSPLLYTGDGGSSTGITGVGFQPDWVWIKRYNAIENHNLYDSTRGVNKRIQSNRNVAETTEGLPAFGSDGFTVDASGGINNVSSQTYVSWNWRANGGTTSSNGNGSITSTVQVDPSGGFSIVNYTGYDSTWGNLSTVGHGLSVAPNCILSKTVDADQWEGYHWAVGNGGGSNAASNSIALNLDSALYTNQTYKGWGGVMPTSTVYTVNGNNLNKAGTVQRAYCFANTEGYIKTGSYEGNGNADGTFVYCGFRPAWIMTKSIDSTSDWQMFDDKRVGYNVDNNELQANDSAAEATTDMIDILSNGFKLRIATDPNVAETYVFLAMAENPFQYATAR